MQPDTIDAMIAKMREHRTKLRERLEDCYDLSEIDARDVAAAAVAGVYQHVQFGMLLMVAALRERPELLIMSGPELRPIIEALAGGAP